MRVAILFAVAAAVLGASASAATVTENTLVDAITNDFSAGRGSHFGSGPVDESVGGDLVTWAAESPDAKFDFGDSTDLAGNGSWNGGRKGYVGTNSPTAAMSFTFADPVAAVGGFVNYSLVAGAPAGAAPTLATFGIDGALLETFDLLSGAPITTAHGNNRGAFRGFSRAANDIARFELRGSFIVLDDLAWSRVAAVPLPPALPLLAVALGGLALVNRRRPA